MNNCSVGVTLTSLVEPRIIRGFEPMNRVDGMRGLVSILSYVVNCIPKLVFKTIPEQKETCLKNNCKGNKFVDKSRPCNC